MRLIITLIVMAVAFLAIDIAWIVLFVSEAYEAALGPILRESPAGAAAGLFYVGYILGTYHFAVRPALASHRVSTALVNGAALGALTYGTYALTSYALFEGWIPSIVVADILWGGFLTAVTAAVGFLVARGRADRLPD